MHLGIVTATIDRPRAEPCLQSWLAHATVEEPPIVCIEHGDPWQTTVEAFGRGVDQLLREPDVEVIACLHDDLVIFEPGWDATVLVLFEAHPDVGLARFVGGEVEGGALLGRRAFWHGFTKDEWRTKSSRRQRFVRPWAQLATLGFTHYWTDDALRCLAERGRWEIYDLPMRGRHLGGLTIRDPRYQAWAASTTEGGDRGFYEAAQQLAHDHFRDVLPLRPEVTPAAPVERDDAARR